MYVNKYIALRYSKITIFATACRFLVQALRRKAAAKRVMHSANSLALEQLSKPSVHNGCIA
ncbi:hypothetical protein BLA27_26790 [Brucella cytisi]|uniref:Uncharacterized protein n=1 Tax=Brucella cytisi TaxID=407152 RepID=A0A1J6HQJ0_9HYPH|nr:hypothetical protein BLA27_26790 [Brucella cytisi]